MDGFISRANVDHYLDLLNDGNLPAEKRATVTKLLIIEEDKLACTQEHLDFAEIHAVKGRVLLNELRCALDAEQDRESRAQTERLISAVETTQSLIEGLCDRLRLKMSVGL